jgi:hypothetical protein
MEILQQSRREHRIGDERQRLHLGVGVALAILLIPTTREYDLPL